MNKFDLFMQEILTEDFTEKERAILIATARECHERQALIEKNRKAGEVNMEEVSHILETALQKLMELNRSLEVLLKNMQGMVIEAATDQPKTLH